MTVKIHTGFSQNVIHNVSLMVFNFVFKRFAVDNSHAFSRLGTGVKMVNFLKFRDMFSSLLIADMFWVF